MKFKESPLVKNHKILTGTKRDMRKKVVKSTTPTSDLKKPTTLKRQLGGNIFTTYNSIAPYEGPIFEQPVATVEIEELPVSRLETNRRNVITKAEEKKEEPVVEEKVSTKPLPTSKEETPVVENKESTPVNIKSKDEFIKTMTPAFENALKAKGLDTKYAKYLVAQSALESNWGKSQSGKFNFGGIKGKGTIKKTREVINGKSIHVNDSFRDFKDINDYANYHVSLLNNKRYNAFTGDFIDRVVKGGYATDPNYKKALSNVYNQIAKAKQGGVLKAKDGIVTQVINKVKSILPKEEPKESINVIDVAKEYAPSAVASMLLGNINPFVSKLLEGKKPSLDYSHKFGSTGNKFEEFASVMTPIFKEALEENGLPITNLNNLVRQAALESNYGLDPRGERGFNLSGIKHPGDSIAPKYKKSRYKDGFDYIDFDNLKDYANYKVKVLNDRYKALDAKDTNDFIDRLHGNNSGKYNYSADKDSYRRNLNGTLSLNKYLKRGGIVKYQNPSSGIQRKDAIKDYRPQIQEPIKQQYTPTYSEISQDNRSEWEKSQSREKADKAYRDYMQAKNTEEAVRTLDGLATMSDYIGLGAGVGSIIGRGLKYAGKRIARNAVKATASTTGNSTSLKFGIGKEILPDYAKPNWQGNALTLTKDRLKNGGFDRLDALKGNQNKIVEIQKKFGLDPRDFDYSYDDYSPKGREALLEAQPKYGKASDFGETPDAIGIANREKRYFTSMFDDAPNRTNASINGVEGHEYSHFVFDPDKLPPLDTYDFNKIPEQYKEYFMGTLARKNRGMELTARGTQIKNYFGLKEGDPITEDMLKYAAENYVKDRGYDNAMNMFFGGIKDYKKMAEWLTKWSPILAAPIIENANDKRK